MQSAKRIKLSTKKLISGKNSPSKVREKLRYPPDKQKLREPVTIRASLEEMLTGVLLVEMKGHQTVIKPYEKIKILVKVHT